MITLHDLPEIAAYAAEVPNRFPNRTVRVSFLALGIHIEARNNYTGGIASHATMIDFGDLLAADQTVERIKAVIDDTVGRTAR